MTEIVSLIGYPLKHSVSPSMQQAAFDHYRLSIRYEEWETEPSRLGTAIDRLRQPGVIGANVTIPHKEAVVPLLDELDPLAADIGAVNTVVNRNGRLCGYNTDAPGCIRALRDAARFEPGRKSVLLIGAGGAARAVGFALVREGVGQLVIANRRQERAQALAESLQRNAGGTTEIGILSWQAIQSPEAIAGYDLVVNCTSLGTKHTPTENAIPLDPAAIPRHALIYDLVYNPIETPLLREAKRTGATVLGGLAMLVYQGAASFELWVGREPPTDIMFAEARKALGEDPTCQENAS